MQLRGYIDRVDLAELADELLGIVIDYKRTRQKRLKLDEVYHGLSLQLLGYLLVLAEHGATLAKRIGMIFCERIQDASCIGCAKCYKSVNENTFAFEDQGEVRIVFKTSCGDCPGLVVPKVFSLTDL